MKRKASIFILVFMIATFSEVFSCTRVVYKGPNGTVLTARSMDWNDNIETNLWIFPRGIQRNGEVGSSSLKWISKYGSVVASAYDIASTDGMNEKGLVANVLWLAESQYPAWNQITPGLSIAAWVQYVLDNFSTVNEAVEELKLEKFTLVTSNLPGQSKLATLHLSISDANGDNAIFQYVNGKLIIYHDPAYQVMTNSPTFEKQLALNEYWKEIGGNTMLPGTNRAADRFVRASFYINSIPQTDDTRTAIASVFSVIRNVSVPFGISSPGHPNISSTRWRTVSDHKNKVYYFESALTPNTFWVDFKNVDFTESAKSRKLTLTNNETYSGDASSQFIQSIPFKFEGISGI